MAISSAFTPFKTWVTRTVMNGSFNPVAAATFGTPIYSVSNGGQWANQGVATALTGADLPVTIAWVGDLTELKLEALDLKGPVEPIPSTVTKCERIIGANRLLTGPAPELSPDVTEALAAYYSCSGLTAPPSRMPPLVKNGLGFMYGCSNMVGLFSTLSPVLENGRSVFQDCEKLTGPIPTIPPTLNNAETMFAGCPGARYTAGTLATTTCTNWLFAFQDCAFTEAEVNAMFADLRAAHTAGVLNGAALRFDVGGSATAPPSGQGITDRDFLRSLGAHITTN